MGSRELHRPIFSPIRPLIDGLTPFQLAVLESQSVSEQKQDWLIEQTIENRRLIIELEKRPWNGWTVVASVIVTLAAAAAFLVNVARWKN